MKVILKPRVHSNYLLVQFCENRALGLKQIIDSCVCGAFILFTFHWIHWSSSTFGCICRFDASRFEWMARISPRLSIMPLINKHSVTVYCCCCAFSKSVASFYLCRIDEVQSSVMSFRNVFLSPVEILLIVRLPCVQCFQWMFNHNFSYNLHCLKIVHPYFKVRVVVK